MKFTTLITALLATTIAGAQGIRKEAGEAFLEPQQKRDSVLIADQFRYGVLLENLEEGTPVSLPEFQLEKDAPLEILGSWQLDSTRISKRKEQPARYNIKASLLLTAFMGGTYELPEIPVLVGTDTLVFKAAEPLEVKELPIDMESFQAHDIKPQVKFPYTFKELFPWIIGVYLIGMIIAALILWLKYRSRKQREEEALLKEPAHIRALRKLDEYRGEKFWKPEQQKTFYSGVTDALREYIAARYEVGAMEMTTAEIFQDLKGTDIPEDLYQEMKALFERADFVKFAKYTAPDQENAKVLPQAVRFVTSTYQQEIADQVGNDAHVMPDTDRASSGNVMPGNDRVMPDNDRVMPDNDNVMPDNDRASSGNVMPGNDLASEKEEE